MTSDGRGRDDRILAVTRAVAVFAAALLLAALLHLTRHRVSTRR